MFLFSSAFFGCILLSFTLSPSTFFDLLSEREITTQFNTQTLIAQRDSQANNPQFLKENDVSKRAIVSLL